MLPMLCMATVDAAQIDIPGPAGSGAFGSSVTVLPNGNIVVTDPLGPVSNVGAVYLYNPAGVLISTITGSTANDQVGSGGITVLTNGNFLIRSPFWHNGAAVDAGAVTWASATTGISGVVSPLNSLTGTKERDYVGFIDNAGFDGVTVLSNGNYVVASPQWDNGGSADAGAVTWGNGSTGTSGAVAPANSLIGPTAGAHVGFYQAIALSNGNYVVVSPFWRNPNVIPPQSVGAVTWVNGSSGLVGVVSTANSLVGATEGDAVGLGSEFSATGVTALSNGNYVVASSRWHNDSGVSVGAITWANGATGRVGVVSAANSLIGSTANDFPAGNEPVTALSNGNYVIPSPFWDNGSTVDAGAVTWANGSTGLVGVISASNSLVGTGAQNLVGLDGVVALTNGNYVVQSPSWDKVDAVNAGAVTWGNGSSGISGVVSPANSLVGTETADQIGSNQNGAAAGVVALTNGNYVVVSTRWNHDAIVDAGAVTWANGASGRTGAVSAANSLVGTTTNDFVGGDGVTALSNGNYVVASGVWDGAAANVGAVTWANGSTGRSGPVSSANSLIGSQSGDSVGGGRIAAIGSGHYVVPSRLWNNGATTDVGAVTWANGGTGLVGVVSAANSLIGVTANDHVGSFVSALEDGSYAVLSSDWDRPPTVNAGAVSLARSDGGLIGTIVAANSVRGSVTNANFARLPFDYDPPRQQLVVGRPASNIVSLFTLPPGLPFGNGFE
jgi:hypothetical protein